ncbi:RTA-like protein [Penicillium ucsense]|uniref:RTA-like protein n=1 Tax=Penicillium ucsense TaxID=2839758 RepID=A0A8J8WN42_9EURO|nr:RTA-like protein [Penicillium ucsense]KAF7734331.1 RTA-like protein [Penicillium ucsense]
MSASTDQYGYLPSTPPALFAIVYFGIAVIAIVTQTIFGKYTHYWMFTLALTPAGEAIGWGARYWAHSNPVDWMPYVIQLCSLIVCPVFLSATNYILFCKIAEKTGPKLFLIPNRIYWILFVILDIISLTIQTIGGVMTSNAENFADLDYGSNVMLNGIIFQFSCTVFFVVLVAGMIFRSRAKGITLVSVTGWPIMITLWLSAVMILIRNGYRIAELHDGWKGHWIRTEWYLIAFDMAPMAVAVAAYIVISPSHCLSNDKKVEEHKRARLSDCIPLC